MGFLVGMSYGFTNDMEMKMGLGSHGTAWGGNGWVWELEGMDWRA